MAFTIYDADLAPSTAEASLAGATLAFSPTSAVPVNVLAVLVAVWDNTDGTNADDTTFLTVTDSKGNGPGSQWIRAGEAQYSPGGLAADGLIAGVYYSVITTQIETTDTITVTHSSALGVFKGLTLAAFNRDTAKGVAVAGKGYDRGSSTTAYTITVSGLTNEPHLWVGENGMERSPGDLNTADGDYTQFSQGGTFNWGAGFGASAAIGGRGGYRIFTSTTETYDRTALSSADRCTVLVAFRENVAPVAVGQAVETDTARALVVSKVRLVGQAIEVDSAQTVSAARVIPLGRATETDTSLTITVLKSLAVGVASEVDSAGSVAVSKALAVGQATESDQAQTVSPQRAYATGQAQESDAAQAVSGAKSLLTERATEVDSATALTATKTLAIGPAVEADSAGDITPIRCTQPDSTIINGGTWTTQAIGLDLHTAIDETPANDADFIQGPVTLLAATDTCEVGLGNVTDPAVSTGHVVSYRYEKSAANEQVVDLIVRLVQGTTVIATWTHLAIANGWTTASQTLTGLEANAINDYTDLRLRFSQVTATSLIARRARVSWAQFCVPIESGVVVQVGQAPEADTAQTVARSKALAIGRAVEIDSAQIITPVLSGGEQTIAVGQAIESDTVLPITSRKVLVVGPALEADTALEMVAAKVIPILKALETDTARGIAYQPIIGRAIETDLARGLVRNLAFDILQCEAKWAVTDSGLKWKAEQCEAKWAVTPSG